MPPRQHVDEAVAFLVLGFWAVSGNLLRGIVPRAEQARAAALQVVLIGVLIALMLVLRPRGIFGEQIGVSRHVPGSDGWRPGRRSGFMAG